MSGPTPISANRRRSRENDMTLPMTMNGRNNNNDAAAGQMQRRSVSRRVLTAAGRPLRRLVGKGNSAAARRRSRVNMNGADSRYGTIPSSSYSEVNAATMNKHQVSPLHDERSTAVTSASGRSTSHRHPSLLPGENHATKVLEGILRQIILLLLAYMVGVWKPSWYPVVERIAEYSFVAWVTCIVILVLAIFQHAGDSKEEDAGPDELQPLLTSSVQDRGLDLPEEDSPLDSGTFAVDALDKDPDPVMLEEKQGMEFPHPSLDPFFVINSENNERIIPNIMTPTFRLSNDYFDGFVMIMIRTPDVDDPNVIAPAANAATSAYFTGRQRRFEFQFQVKVKQVPKGRVFFACELEEPVKMGMIQKAFASAAMAFMKKMNPTFHYSITGQPETDDGMFEKPHMAFTVEGSMDRLIATPPGQEPPKLGTELYEDPQSIKYRSKGGAIEWNTEDTYTFALWSAYADFLDWRCLNLPGIRPFPLQNIISTQHITLTLYDIPLEAEKHYRSDLTMITGLEMSNTNMSRLGPLAKKWLESHEKPENRMVRLRSFDEDELVGVDILGTDEIIDDLEGIDDEETAAELGEGLYITSGERYVIQEDLNGSTVINGGGFCVLQERSSSSLICIEKLMPPRRQQSKSLRQTSKLIRSGDVVSIKLLTGTNGKSDVKHLSIHRGWWLKWVNLEPNKNGFFTIHGKDEDDQSGPFLTLGSPFLLRHKRWEGYEVGVSADESPTYGGHMLGLFKPNGGQDDRTQNPDDEDGENMEIDANGSAGTRANEWMRPLFLTATTQSVLRVPTLAPATTLLAAQLEGPVFTLSIDNPDSYTEVIDENLKLDVPVWIELMNRADRRRQLVYAVRVVLESTVEIERKMNIDEKDEDIPVRRYISFVRLRTGRDLASLMQIGVRSPSPQKDRPRTPTPTRQRTGSTSNLVVPTQRSTITNEASQDKPAVDFRVPDEFLAPTQTAFEEDEDVPSENGDGIENFDDMEDLTTDDFVNETTSTVERPRGRKIFGQLAKSVKTGTVTTGKQVVRQSKKVIKAPISRTRSKRPPIKEPRSMKTTTAVRVSRRLKERDDHKLVNRTMRRMGRSKSGRWLSVQSTTLAGQLSGPDQSRRTASHVLERLSASMQDYDGLLAAQVNLQSDFDRYFLKGGAAQLGVVPSETNVVFGSVVARCLWESHWREEWVGLTPASIVFYAPLAKQPSLQLGLSDVRTIRILDLKEFSPLPGYPMLAIETAWLVYYVSFSDMESREKFVGSFDSLKPQQNDEMDESRETLKENFLSKARFWQGFQDAVKAAETGGKRKWAKIPTGKQMKHRTILNCRKMDFDVESALVLSEGDSITARAAVFSSKLLGKALGVTPNSLENDPDQFIELLDMASQLRSISPGSLDLTSADAFCFFVNVYHCLLQHALLVTVNGPLHKRSVGHFMRTTCYEIGGDIFSLAELQQCVIRGNMGKPFSPKAPYLDVPRRSAAYKEYALEFVDPKINFVLHTGDHSCPQNIQVLQADTLKKQLFEGSRRFLHGKVVVDVQKRIVTLPKICDVYRADFGSTDVSTLRYSLHFLDDELETTIRNLIKEEYVMIRFHQCSEQYYPFLIGPGE